MLRVTPPDGTKTPWQTWKNPPQRIWPRRGSNCR